MSKATAAASIVGGLLLALVSVVGFAALIVLTLADLYTAGMVLWVGLPLIFVVGATLLVYGIAVGIREVSDVAGELSGLSDVSGTSDVKQLYKRLS